MSILPVSPSLHPSKADLWQSRRVRCKLCGYYSILYYIYLFIYLFHGVANQTEAQDQVRRQLQLSPRHQRLSHRLFLHCLYYCILRSFAAGSAAMQLLLVSDQEWSAPRSARIQGILLHLRDVTYRLPSPGSHHRICGSMQSNDGEYSGKAIVTFGTIELDISLKTEILNSLSQGYNTLPMFLVGSEQ